MDDKDQEKLYVYIIREQASLFLSGFNAGIASIFLMIRLAAPTEFHSTFNLLIGIGVFGMVAFWGLKSHYQKKIAAFAYLLGQKKGKSDG